MMLLDKLAQIVMLPAKDAMVQRQPNALLVLIQDISFQLQVSQIQATVLAQMDTTNLMQMSAHNVTTLALPARMELPALVALPTENSTQVTII